jgi:3-oxoacyl-[acyl-carrier-protein] synthase II
MRKRRGPLDLDRATGNGHAVPVVVTGVGPISAIGCGAEEFWESLLAGRHGFGSITLCDASRSPSKIAAEVAGFDLGRYVPRGGALARQLPRPVQFALAAAALALEDSGLVPGRFHAGRVGVWAGTSLGNAFEGLSARDRWVRGDAGYPSDSAFRLFHHSAACVLSSYFDLRGPVQTSSTGCNSGLDALGQALRLVQRNEVDAMLVVGTDCEVIPEILAILCASDSLTTRYNDDPGRASRPYDLDRDGNVVGEGAAAVVLESEPHARARGGHTYARVAGYASRAAGGHRRYSARAPAIDLGACASALRAAMAEAGWKRGDVDVINANGSSSVIYDRVEGLALTEVFGDALAGVRVHSVKSMLGQHGAGTSALQVVAACLAIDRGTVPPTINHERRDPACGAIRVVADPEPTTRPNVLVHSIGLGGFYYSCGAFGSTERKEGEA